MRTTISMEDVPNLNDEEAERWFDLLNERLYGKGTVGEDLPEWVSRELDQREAESYKDPSCLTTWEEIKSNILRDHAKKTASPQKAC